MGRRKDWAQYIQEQHRRWQPKMNPKADLAVFMNSTKVIEYEE